MQVINWSGAIFGPGSEWFWAFAQFIVVLVTLLGIWRQLRLQADATAIEQMNDFRREAYSEQMLRYELDVMLALRDGADPTAIPEAAALGIGDYWANFATLARRRHRNLRLLWQSDSATPQIVWALLGPWALMAGAASWQLGKYGDLEWLAARMAEMDREVGREAITPELVASKREAWITLHRDLIRYAQAFRADIASSTIP